MSHARSVGAPFASLRVADAMQEKTGATQNRHNETSVLSPPDTPALHCIPGEGRGAGGAFKHPQISGPWEGVSV